MDDFGALAERARNTTPPAPGEPLNIEEARGFLEWATHPRVCTWPKDSAYAAYLTAALAEVESAWSESRRATRDVEAAMRETDAARAEVERLRRLIDTHRSACIDQGCVVQADIDLWEAAGVEPAAEPR